MYKKFLSFALISSAVIVSGCTMPRSKSDSNTSSSLSTSSSMTTSNAVDCKKAVEDYLTQTKSYKVDTDKTVTGSAQITVDYVGRLADGTVFDTSVESVAKSCGVYAEQRDYKSGLAFTAGAGQMIAGFDRGVMGMAINETKTITIPAKEAYGEATITIPLSELPNKSDGTAYKAGDNIVTQNGAIKIESMTDRDFTIKNPHPLAGKDLIFDITIKSIK